MNDACIHQSVSLWVIRPDIYRLLLQCCFFHLNISLQTHSKGRLMTIRGKTGFIVICWRNSISFAAKFQKTSSFMWCSLFLNVNCVQLCDIKLNTRQFLHLFVSFKQNMSAKTNLKDCFKILVLWIISVFLNLLLIWDFILKVRRLYCQVS